MRRLRKIAYNFSVTLLVLLVYFGAIAPVWADGSGSSLSPKEFLRSGVTAFQAGDYRTAVERFTAAIDADREYSAAYSDRCLTYIYLEDYPAAVQDCTQALQFNPRDTEAYLNRGLAYHHLRQPVDAIADYNQLLQLKSDDFRAYYNRGLARAEQLAYREAIVDYGAALRQVSPLAHSLLGEIHNDRGLAQLGLEHWPQAIADFTQAIQFSSGDIRAYYNRGCAYHHQGNLMAALDDFTRVLEIAPSYAQAYLSRGLLQQQIGNTESAIADLQQAAQLFQTQGAMVAYQQTLDLLAKLQGSNLAIG